jgi:hypothetical protein
MPNGKKPKKVTFKKLAHERSTINRKLPAKMPPAAYPRVGDIAHNRVSTLKTLAASKIPRDMTRGDVSKFVAREGERHAINIGLVPDTIIRGYT